MKHKMVEVSKEDSVVRRERAEFERWMKARYPGIKLEVNALSGFYEDMAANACWEVWLYREST